MPDFQVGDLVKLLPLPKDEKYVKSLRPGMIGTIRRIEKGIMVLVYFPESGNEDKPEAWNQFAIATNDLEPIIMGPRPPTAEERYEALRNEVR